MVGFIVGKREPDVRNGAGSGFVKDGESFAGRNRAKIGVATGTVVTGDALKSVVVRLRECGEPAGRLREYGSRSDEEQREQTRKEDSRFHRRSWNDVRRVKRRRLAVPLFTREISEARGESEFKVSEGGKAKTSLA
jgi:hypothetical protein